MSIDNRAFLDGVERSHACDGSLVVLELGWTALFQFLIFH